MEKEIRLVKTCIGMVSEDTIKYLSDRAIEVAIEADVTFEEATTILLKIASKAIRAWYKSGNEWYFDFDFDYDFFAVNKRYDSTEIACLFNDEYNIVYNIEKQKFYKEYSANEYGDELIKEEIEWKKN